MRRLATVLFAASLVALPGIFAVFPEWTTAIGPWPKGALLGGWLVAVWLSARVALQQGEQLDELIGPALERRRKQKQLAARRLLTLLLSREHGLPAAYRFHLYTPDEVNQEMVPVFAPDPRPPNWPFGTGVTGEAWRRKTYVIARGEDVHNGSYGLPAALQTKYADVNVVAALPVLDDGGRPIAVLTASSPVDDGHLASPDGFDRHQELAQIAGRILQDIAELRPDAG
jgi:hypothetical protein